MINEVPLIRAGRLWLSSQILTYGNVVYNLTVQDQTVGDSSYREIVLSLQFETHIDQSLLKDVLK